MSMVGIVTDSIGCIPANFIKEYNIQIAPIGLVIDGNMYKDTELSNDEFWKLYFAAKKLPTTTGNNPANYVECFKESAKSSSDILCITLSGKLSNGYDSAVKARELIKEEIPQLKIEIIDSNIAMGAEGFLVMEAARAARAGKSLNEIIPMVTKMIPRVKWIMAMDTLKYLIKGGRAPKTAIIAEVANIKPVAGMVSGSGKVDNLGRVRGKQKAMEKVTDMIKDYADVNKPLHLMVHYTTDIIRAEKLKEMITTRYTCEEVYLTPFTPSMVIHTGPIVAVSFYS
jgi:DegV family protein with EDD domain